MKFGILYKPQIITVLLISTFQLQAQTELGAWQDHLPYNKCIAVDRNQTTVFSATPYGFFAFDINDRSMTRYNRVNGLSDHFVSTIKVQKSTGTLVIGYENGNIDLWNNGEVYNIPFIKTTTNITGNKRINQIYITGDTAFLSTGFGIVQLDLTRREIRETYRIAPGNMNITVNSVITHGDSIWAGTETSVYFARISNPLLTDASSWHKMTSLPDSIENKPYNNLMWFNNALYVNYDHPVRERDIYLKRTSSGWQHMTATQNREMRTVMTNGKSVVIAHDGFLAKYDTSFAQLELYYTYLTDEYPDPLAAIIDDDDFVKWIADGRQGMVRLQEQFFAEAFTPTGPFSAGSFGIDVQDGVTWVVPGMGWSSQFVLPSFSRLEEGTWSHQSFFNNDILDTLGIYDLVSVATNPNDPTEAFIGSLSDDGMFRVKDMQITDLYTPANSTLQERLDLPGAVYVSGMVFDTDGNLWIGNPFAQYPLSVRTPSGAWYSFNLGGEVAGKLVTHIAIDQQNNKWMLVNNVGVVIFNDNGTLNNPNDDTYRVLTTQAGNGGLPGSSLKSILIDLDGEIWLGTETGVVVFFSPAGILEGNAVDAQQILLEQDGNIQVLLETETVTAMAVDGANRKWLGTQSGGVFLMSADGTKQIESFNTDNSPLFSNNIQDIAWDEKTGVVYFATQNGLLAYKSDATKADAYFTNVYAYPNPVKPDFTGNIGIKGLARDSYVKITDVAGNLVYETRSVGGLATWDGKKFTGEKVSTGVYLILATDAEGKEGIATKILVVNE